MARGAALTAVVDPKVSVVVVRSRLETVAAVVVRSLQETVVGVVAADAASELVGVRLKADTTRGADTA